MLEMENVSQSSAIKQKGKSSQSSVSSDRSKFGNLFGGKSSGGNASSSSSSIGSVNSKASLSGGKRSFFGRASLSSKG